jgi:hypothetical protein
MATKIPPFQLKKKTRKQHQPGAIYELTKTSSAMKHDTFLTGVDLIN